MKNYLIIILLVFALFLPMNATASFQGVHQRLLNLNVIKNWSYSLHILGIDLLIGYIARNLQELTFVSSIDTQFSISTLKNNTSSPLSIKLVAELALETKLAHFNLLSINSGALIFGNKYFQDDSGKVVRETVCHDLFGQEHPLRESGFNLIVDSGGEFVAFKRDELNTFYIFSPEMTKQNKIVLQQPLFIRNAWRLGKNDEYLLFHFPFNSGCLFSKVDSTGQVLESFYNIPIPAEDGLRSWFIDHFQMAAFNSGHIFLSKVFPNGRQLILEEIDPSNERITVYKADIDGFSGQHDRFKQTPINSLGWIRIAAVNNIFANEDMIFVSLSVSDNQGSSGSDFHHYLYVFERGKGFVGLLEIPYGAVVHYHPGREEFISLRDRAVGFNPTFVMFSVETGN